MTTLPWAALEGTSRVLLPALEAVLAGSPAAGELGRVLRAHPDWTALERTAVAEALFGVALWRRRLAWHAGRDAPSPADAKALLFCLLRDLGDVPEPEASELAGGLLNPPRARGAPSEFSFRFSVPDWLASTVARELTGGAEGFLEALNQPGPITVRANRLKTTPKELALVLAAEGVLSTPATFAPDALHLEGRPNIYGSASHQQGAFEVQDEGSQLLGSLLGVRPGHSVLDLCAGAGGKTLLLAAALQNQGTLYAYDPDLERLDRLGRRAVRAGVTTLRVLRGLPESLRVDRVLVDAPCSSLGALRRGPDARFQLDPSTFGAFPPLQLDLLETAARHLAPGGRILYGTCTFRREENAEVVDRFLDIQPDFRRLRLEAPWWSEMFHAGGDFQCLPHLHGTDGFFGALLGRG